MGGCSHEDGSSSPRGLSLGLQFQTENLLVTTSWFLLFLLHAPPKGHLKAPRSSLYTLVPVRPYL
ncbi:hypothetical protein VULLAG_LOCUS12834 [Vulpes lagopus]